MQQVTSDFLQWATFATSNEWFFATSNERILQRVTSDFLQWATSGTSNERILQRATFETSNEQILQWATSDFTTSNEQRVDFNK